MYKKKLAPKEKTHSWASTIAVVITLLAMLLLEYFFFFPSEWLHAPAKTDVVEEKNIGCTKEYAPVCGRDGNTYGNSCMIRAAGVAVARVGECPPPLSEIPPSADTGATPITTLPLSPEPLPPQEASTGILSLTASGDLDPTKYLIYTNTTFGYTVAMPRYVYYQGGISPDRDGHLLAIGFSGTGVENFATAPVKLRYYTSSVNPPLTGNMKLIPLVKGSATIDYTEPLTPRAKEIIDTIILSLKSVEK